MEWQQEWETLKAENVFQSKSLGAGPARCRGERSPGETSRRRMISVANFTLLPSLQSS